MNEKPILFSGPMVQAILDGHKTQTRRVWRKPKRHAYNDVLPVRAAGRFELASGGFCIGETIRCPYGQPGDTEWSLGIPPADGWYYVREFSEDRPVWLRRYKAGLLWGYNEHDDPEAIEVEGLEASTIEWKRPGDTLWVRETWATPGNYDHIKPSELMAGDFASSSTVYRATEDYGDVYYKWRPSIYMPRWASRITLRVLSVRVERVQDISEEDARAEGARHITPSAMLHAFDPKPNNGYRAGFELLWNLINAHRGLSWHVNPWVWVVEFQKVE